MLQQHSQEISLVLLDIVMPEMDGFGVLSMMNKNHWIEDIPVIMISAESGSSHIERAYELGVTDFRVVSNCGAQAGQSVPHLHFHVLAGRDMTWPPG